MRSNAEIQEAVSSGLFSDASASAILASIWNNLSQYVHRRTPFFVGAFMTSPHPGHSISNNFPSISSRNLLNWGITSLSWR